MSRHAWLAASAALAILAGASAQAASSDQAGNAAATGGAQSSVGDTGNGNGTVMPENPSNQTAGQPMQDQSNAGTAANGPADSSPAPGSLKTKKMPPKPGQSAGPSLQQPGQQTGQAPVKPATSGQQALTPDAGSTGANGLVKPTKDSKAQHAETANNQQVTKPRASAGSLQPKKLNTKSGTGTAGIPVAPAGEAPQ